MTTATTSTTDPRAETIANLTAAREQLLGELAAAPHLAGSEWAADRRDELAHAERTLARLGVLPTGPS